MRSELTECHLISNLAIRKKLYPTKNSATPFTINSKTYSAAYCKTCFIFTSGAPHHWYALARLQGFLLVYFCTGNGM